MCWTTCSTCNWNCESQKAGPLGLYDILPRLHQKSTDVGNFWQRKLHFISSSAIASDKFIAVQHHLPFPWQWQQTTGGGVGGLWTGDCRQRHVEFKPVEKTPGLCEGPRRTPWTHVVAYCVLLKRIVSNNLNVALFSQRFMNNAWQIVQVCRW